MNQIYLYRENWGINDDFFDLFYYDFKSPYDYES